MPRIHGYFYRVMQKVAESQETSAADDRWVTVEGGARVSFDGVADALAGLAVTDPAQFVSAMQSGKFKQFLDREDYDDLKIKQRQAEDSITDLSEKTL